MSFVAAIDARPAAHDLVFAVRGMRIDFRRPARLDDLLDVSASLRECRKASLVIAQEIRRGDTLLLDAEVRVAALCASGFKPRPIPRALYEQLQRHVPRTPGPTVE